MERRRSRTALVALVFTAALLAAGVAQGEVKSAIPYGAYQGSAVGGDAAPFGVTVYISPAANGMTEVSARTDLIPIPISVQGKATPSGSGWDIPVSVNQTMVKLTGSGVIHIRPGEGDWVLYGAGDGSFRGNSGSGHGYGKRVSKSTSAGQQVIDALSGFASFGASDEGPVPVPPEFKEEPPASDLKPADAKPAGDAAAPPDFTESFEMFVVWILFLLMGLF